MSMAGIYQIRNALNGHCYIGQSVDLFARLDRHRGLLRAGSSHNRHLQAAWNKYGEAAFVFEPLAAIDGPITKLELTDLEQDYVDFFLPVYNKRIECTDSCAGVRHTAEARAKMSASQLGQRRPAISAAKMGHAVSAETRAKIGDANRGRHHEKSPETRAKLSASKMGHAVSAEQRAKQSETMARLWAERKAEGMKGRMKCHS
jgi:group I intron endonuclease